MGGGLGLLGAEPFRRAWSPLASAGSGASLLLLFSFQPQDLIPGALLDLAILAGLGWWSLGRGERLQQPPRRRWLRVFGSGFGVAIVFYASVVVASRPWIMRWGSTDDELRAALPGDELVEPPVRYAIQHAVTIDAPPSEVWPWLVQIGQDRAGFYSYDWLERLFGTGIHNAERIVPEWQQRAAGDSVFATPSSYLGTAAHLGWRVSKVEPGRLLVLDKWGAFIVVPAGDGASRLIVRTRGGGTTSKLDLLLAPFGVFVFEPAHFIMERRMLLGIKELVERSAAQLEARG
jgi:hypothetical protein